MRRQGHGILADCTPLAFSLFSRPPGRPHSGCVWRENELAVNFWYSELPLWILGKAHRTVILIAIKAASKAGGGGGACLPALVCSRHRFHFLSTTIRACLYTILHGRTYKNVPLTHV